MELSKEQQTVQSEILSLLNRSRFNTPYPNFLLSTRIAGYAGTGKTFLISKLREEIHKQYPNINVAFCSFTGKAASVLKRKLEEQKSIHGDDYIGTIHGLIYHVLTRWDKDLKCHVIVGWERIEPEDFYYDLIIIDEASMVSKEIWKDLVRMGKSIIAVGDHGQLPPISNDGEYFNLMMEPDFMLTEIQRQALDSPIIWLSKFVRENGYVPYNKVFAPGIFKISWNEQRCKNTWNNIDFDENTIVLCAFNQTRCALNDEIRKRSNHKNLQPYPGERVICLRNNHTTKIMNGQIGTVMWVMPETKNAFLLTVDVDGEIFECFVHNLCFGQVTYTMFNKKKDSSVKRLDDYARKKGYNGGVDYFDYGYATSVHKSQGSEWDRVILFEQRTRHWDDDYYTRWLYTAITRAKEKLFIISDYWG